MFAKVFISLLCVNLAVFAAPSVKDDHLLELSIIHLNDFHARFEETAPNSSPCKDGATDCIGGFSRVYNQVQQLVKTRPNAIFLNAGDNYQGTIWFNAFRYNVTQYFLNMLPTDAYTLGNHEFDNKLKGLIPFIKALNAPTVVANIDDKYEPSFQGLYNKSVIIQRGGQKIGIIGVIAKNTNELSSTEKLIFTDETEAVNKEAIRLKNEEDVKIIIVLSHCGLDVDIKMAKNVVPHVNLIVGGHSHTLLYNGEPPNNDRPLGSYPVVVERENGRNVLVVQASAYTKYLGNLTVFYNQSGDVIRWEGQPIFLGQNIQQDPKINAEINVWKEHIDKFSKRLIGKTNVLLNKKECHYQECSIGNFVTDAMVDYYASKADENSWTYGAIAITNSGGIRTSLELGNVTFGDLISLSPFESSIDVGELTGAQIKEVLEYSVDDTKFKISFKQFLQFSGMRVVFDLRNPIGSRVVSLQIKCRECNVPQFETYRPEMSYRFIVPSFVDNGGDGYSMIRDNLKNKIVGELTDVEVIERYFRKVSPVTAGLDGRIIVKH